MSGDITLEGFKELGEKLAQLGKVGGVKVLRSALRKAMKPVLAAAQSSAPVGNKGDPHLRDMLALTVPRTGLPSDVTARVALRLKRPTKSKEQKARLRVARKYKLSKAARKTLGIEWPKNPRRYWHLVEFGTYRTAPKPFIRPAFNSNVSNALEILRTQLAAKVEKAIRNQDPEAGES